MSLYGSFPIEVCWQTKHRYIRLKDDNGYLVITELSYLASECDDLILPWLNIFFELVFLARVKCSLKICYTVLWRHTGKRLRIFSTEINMMLSTTSDRVYLCVVANEVAFMGIFNSIRRISGQTALNQRIKQRQTSLIGRKTIITLGETRNLSSKVLNALLYCREQRNILLIGSR